MSQAGRFLTDTVFNAVETLTGNTGGDVGPDSNQNINVIGDGTVTVAGDAATYTLTISVGDAVATSYVTDSGTAIPAANILNVLGGTGLATAGLADTLTIGLVVPVTVPHGGTGATTLTGVLTGNGTSAFTASAVTEHDVLVGGASNAITSVAPSATAGVPLVSAGAAADPSFGTAVVAGGGTGIVTTTAYAPICGGTTATGNFQAADTGLSTSGFILTSNGASALPSFQAPAASSISITGDSGGALTGAAFTFTGGTTGLTFAGATSTETLGGTLVVSNGGTGVSTMTTAYAPVCAGTTATGALQVASTGLSTSGYVLTSNGSSALPSFQAVPASGGVTWSTITANQTAAVNNGYFCNKAGTLALALPATSAVGDVIEVVNINTATGTQFTQAAGQQIFIANGSTTSGATGTLTSVSVGDSLKMVCQTANLTWYVVSMVGNWTTA